ncbi:MAG: hypothetical protein KDA24_16075 [Deltaproteobacteria bacterium]|nr:hypothetical protein [Deltaproteobacteria bacterium]
MLHLEPADRGLTSGTFPAIGATGSGRSQGFAGIVSGADVAVTISWRQVAVHGPQGLLDVLESVVAESIPAFDPAAVRLDRWGEEAWVGCWAWLDNGPDGARACQVVVIGHDEGAVTAMVHGDPQDVAHHEAVCDHILASIRLSPSDLLSPQSFGKSLCEVLNERAVSVGEDLWETGIDGHLRSGSLIVRMPSLYRAYLQSDGDLDVVAAMVDSHPRSFLERRWGGLSWDKVADHIRVVLRRREAVEELDVVQVELAGGLVACPVLDTGDRMTFIPSSEAERWGLDGRALLTSAVAQLDRDDPSVVIAAADDDGMPRGLMLADEDGYDSGRLLSPNFRAQLERALGGPLLVAMPSAWTIHVWRDTPSARRKLSQLAEQGYNEEPTPLSAGLWRWEPEGLTPLD